MIQKGNRVKDARNGFQRTGTVTHRQGERDEEEDVFLNPFGDSYADEAVWVEWDGKTGGEWMLMKELELLDAQG